MKKLTDTPNSIIEPGKESEINSTKALTVAEYFERLPEDRITPMNQLRNIIQSNIPTGFIETMSYGDVGYVVPHTLYPSGYHCDPKLPLPFLSIGSAKGFIRLSHMGMYADQELYQWFVQEYPKYSKLKLDIGKACIRFKKVDQIPLELIGQLAQKMTVSQWIELYEASFVKKK